MFASEENVDRLWDELIKDNELVEREARQDVKDEGPLLDSIMEKWSWSNREPTMEQLSTSLQEITSEQHKLVLSVSQSTASMQSLRRRMVIMERYFVALVRKGSPQLAASEDASKDESSTSVGTSSKYSLLPLFSILYSCVPWSCTAVFPVLYSCVPLSCTAVLPCPVQLCSLVLYGCVPVLYNCASYFL